LRGKGGAGRYVIKEYMKIIIIYPLKRKIKEMHKIKDKGVIMARFHLLYPYNLGYYFI